MTHRKPETPEAALSGMMVHLRLDKALLREVDHMGIEWGLFRGPTMERLLHGVMRRERDPIRVTMYIDALGRAEDDLFAAEEHVEATEVTLNQARERAEIMREIVPLIKKLRGSVR